MGYRIERSFDESDKEFFTPEEWDVYRQEHTYLPSAVRRGGMKQGGYLSG